MKFKDNELFNTLILNGVTYSSVIKDGVRYGDWVSITVEPETKAVLDFAESNNYTPPSSIRRFDNFIKDLKSNNLFTKFDTFYLFAGDAEANFKMINIVQPAKHFATQHGGLEWSKEGVKGNGTNAYIDTNYNATTDGVKFKLNDAHFGGYVFDFDATQVGAYSNPLCGVLTLDLQAIYITNSIHNYINSARLGGSINASFKKTATLNRDNSNSHYALSGNGKQEQAVASTTLTNDKTVILRRRNHFSTVHLSTFHQGAALTLVENNKLNEILERYVSS